MTLDTMEIVATVPKALADSVREAVDAGDYASTTEVVSAALDLWRVQREETMCLRRLYEEGKASGIAGPLDLDKLVARAKERARAAQSG